MSRRSTSAVLAVLEVEELDAVSGGVLPAALFAIGARVVLGRTVLAGAARASTTPYNAVLHRQAQERLAEAYVSGDGRAIRLAQRGVEKVISSIPKPSFWEGVM